MTPLQIEKREFRRRVRGYDPKDVEAFRKEVGAEVERLLALVRQTEASERELRAEVERYRAMEATMKEALLLAQRTADETKAAAHRQSDAAIAETRQRCAGIEAEASQRAEKLRGDLERLKQDRDSLVVYLKAMVEGFAARLNDFAPPTSATVFMETPEDVGVPDTGDSTSRP